MRTVLRIGTLLAGCLLMSGAALQAQQPAPTPPAPAPAPRPAPATTPAPAKPTNPFASAQTLKCAFSTYSVGGWKDGAPTAVTATEDFSFQIAIVNLKKGRGRIVGDTGSVDVALVLTPVSLDVIEQTIVGNFTLTTVFVAGSQNGHYLAVHARHVDLGASPSPSQHYGSCEILK